MAIKYTEDQLNTLDKSFLVQMYLNLQEQLESLTKETHELNEKMQLMMEQLILNKQARFGRSSEKMTDAGQICFKEVDGNILFFNEAEAISNMAVPEPEDLEVKPTRGVKPAGRKEGRISGLGVYSGKKDNRVVKAPHPSSLLRGSLVSASLGAAIMNAKYVNGSPLHRMEKEFERYGLGIDRKDMANWMIRLSEEYLGVLYDRLREKLYDFHVIQADETPVLVKRDGRDAGAKSYMWVYRSGFMNKEQQIILYDYQKARSGEHPRRFLKDYKGICVTDGYQVYHTAEKLMDDLTIAGCWVHCRRGFDEAMQTIAKEHQKESISYLIMKQIQAIYREEGRLKDLSAPERRMQRQVVVKPLVDALFAYLKQNELLIERKGTLRAAFTYALNQEKYLRVFLSDGEVPIDNNASERAIRGFCIGRKNWQMIDTINGAKSSAIIYSIAETAKANYLKPYDYFEYLLTESKRLNSG